MLELGNWLEFAEDRSDVEEAVEPAEPLDRPLDETLDLGCGADVGDNGIDLAGRCLELFLKLVELVREPVDGDDVDAARGELADHCSAHSPGGAGHNYALLFLGHRAPPIF